MLYKINNVNFETNLNFDDIIKIVEEYNDKKGKEYEINKKSILYDTNDIEPYVINGPVWFVEIISLQIKERWPDAYFFLAISDIEKRVVYLQNDHGIIVEKY
ncbi:MAG: hypothetical protein NC489_21865 [Ruminococcus flavefaciens]|nr:hypothetical protein [Ruminococcus flavefaciens]